MAGRPTQASPVRPERAIWKKVESVKGFTQHRQVKPGRASEGTTDILRPPGEHSSTQTEWKSAAGALFFSFEKNLNVKQDTEPVENRKLQAEDKEKRKTERGQFTPQPGRGGAGDGELRAASIC